MTPADKGATVKELPIALNSGDAVLSFPYPMSEDDFDWLKKTLDRLKGRMVGPPQQGECELD